MQSIPYGNSKNRRPVTDRDGVLGKECVYCGDWKPLEGGFTKGPYDGKDHRCRECKKAKKIEAKVAPIIDDTPRQISYAMLRYEGAEIAFETDRSQASLTDLWIAVGRPENQRPIDWLSLPKTKELLSELKVGEQHLYGARLGAHGGTWASPEIALAYAMYLNPTLHAAVLRFVLDRADGFAQGTSPQALVLMQQIIQQQNAMLSAVGLLPSIKQDTRTTAAALAGVDMIRIKQVIRCQIYVFRLLPDSPFYELAMRKCRVPPKPNDHVIAIGRTGPDGNVHELRLADYGGKFPFQPSDYELLCVISTDKEESESILLRHPMQGCACFVLPNGGRSRTFLSANNEGLSAYRSLASDYYTYDMLREMFGDSAQADMFKGL